MDDWRIIQCVPTSATVMTDTLIMSSVGNKAAPLFTRPNMDDSNLHAVEKSAERKNTQAIVTKKNTNNIFTNRLVPSDVRNDGNIEARAACFPSTGI